MILIKADYRDRILAGECRNFRSFVNYHLDNWIEMCEHGGFSSFGYSLYEDGKFLFRIDKKGEIIFEEWNK